LALNKIERFSKVSFSNKILFLWFEICARHITPGCLCVNHLQDHYGANEFESQYSENAPRRRISLSNRLKLVLKHP